MKTNSGKPNILSMKIMPVCPIIKSNYNKITSVGEERANLSAVVYL